VFPAANERVEIVHLPKLSTAGYRQRLTSFSSLFVAFDLSAPIARPVGLVNLGLQPANSGKRADHRWRITPVHLLRGSRLGARGAAHLFLVGFAMTLSMLFVRLVNDRFGAVARHRRDRAVGLDGRRKETQGECQQKEIKKCFHGPVCLAVKTRTVN
jgi:hypothetical protein